MCVFNPNIIVNYFRGHSSWFFGSLLCYALEIQTENVLKIFKKNVEFNCTRPSRWVKMIKLNSFRPGLVFRNCLCLMTNPSHLVQFQLSSFNFSRWFWVFPFFFSLLVST